LALAVYEALKSFGVLQLPCRRSLQYFLGANATAPVVNEKAMSEQRNLYDTFCAQQKREGKKAPLYEGILIFDEVKVQSKVSVIYDKLCGSGINTGFFHRGGEFLCMAPYQFSGVWGHATLENFLNLRPQTVTCGTTYTILSHSTIRISIQSLSQRSKTQML
jgi:hypothetical protein